MDVGIRRPLTAPATTQNPTHNFTDVGVYDVTLTVSDGTTTNSTDADNVHQRDPSGVTVPNPAGEKKNDAQDMWDEEGFTTDVQFQNGNGNYFIQFQSIPGLTDNPPGGCNAVITVGP